ncbi:hypothetical protein C8R46DRAFT_1353952 [Mycena filopes]|nr:hypothetical protein C8R46DRAFT_1353952 [Mycena filopes]
MKWEGGAIATFWVSVVRGRRRQDRLASGDAVQGASCPHPPPACVPVHPLTNPARKRSQTPRTLARTPSAWPDTLSAHLRPVLPPAPRASATHHHREGWVRITVQPCDWTSPSPSFAAAILSQGERAPENKLGAWPAAGHFPPADAWLTQAPGTFLPAGEPLTVILAGSSDLTVLIDSQLDGSMRNLFLGVGFASECLGQHKGTPQDADLGDDVNETVVLRWGYGDPSLGTREETTKGGNHFRYWRQNGKDANSSAVFMATSYGMPIAQGHRGERRLARREHYAFPIDTDSLTNTSTFSGTVAYARFVYSTSISYVSGLLANTSISVNHDTTVGIDGKNALDRLVAVLDVKITTTPANATKPSAAKKTAATPTQLHGLIPTLLLILLGALSL